MKPLLTALVLFCLVIWGTVFFSMRHNDSASLLPGQSLAIASTSAVTLELHSDYPVSVFGPGCKLERTADDSVSCMAGNITVTDTRPRLLIWGRSNRVQYTLHRQF